MGIRWARIRAPPEIRASRIHRCRLETQKTPKKNSERYQKKTRRFSIWCIPQCSQCSHIFFTHNSFYVSSFVNCAGQSEHMRSESREQFFANVAVYSALFAYIFNSSSRHQDLCRQVTLVWSHLLFFSLWLSCPAPNQYSQLRTPASPG